MGKEEESEGEGEREAKMEVAVLNLNPRSDFCHILFAIQINYGTM